MKVSELIEHLKTYDPELTVVVGGFDEWGFDDVREDRMEIVRAVPVAPLSHGPDYEEPEHVVRHQRTVIGEEIEALYLG